MTKKLAVDLGQECIDCLPGSKRPAVYPGPRCATHDRAKIARQKEQAHARHIERTYGITKELYDELYRLQGGKCYVCQIATGKARKLAIDHDHRCCPGPKSCGKCVRGLACGHCNHDVLPWVGDHASDWDRVSNVLQDPIGELLLSGELLQIDVDTRFGRLAGAVVHKREQSGTLKT